MWPRSRQARLQQKQKHGGFLGLLPRLVVEAEGRECTQAILLAAVASAVSRTANPPGVSAKKQRCPKREGAQVLQPR